jgi:hypothetical protein
MASTARMLWLGRCTGAAMPPTRALTEASAALV